MIAALDFKTYLSVSKEGR